MAKQLLVVMTNAADGRDDEFNDWYDHTHLGEVLQVDGITGAQRFTLESGTEDPSRRYLALYEVDTDDMDAVMTRLGDAAAAGEMQMSDSLADPLVWFARCIGDRVTE